MRTYPSLILQREKFQLHISCTKLYLNILCACMAHVHVYVDARPHTHTHAVMPYNTRSVTISLCGCAEELTACGRQWACKAEVTSTYPHCFVNHLNRVRLAPPSLLLQERVEEKKKQRAREKSRPKHN